MDLFTMDPNFVKDKPIDTYESAIWTDRYYGDSEIEIHTAPTEEMLDMLKPDTFVAKETHGWFSIEPMIMETSEITDEGNLKASGISLLKWCNNRFVRTTNDHTVQFWDLSGLSVEDTLFKIFQDMVIDGPYLDGTINTGIPNPAILKLPKISRMTGYTTGPTITVQVPFGPLYDALREIAVKYGIGMEIVRFETISTYALQFTTKTGLDRTSDQSVRDVIRLSPAEGTLTNVKELHSSAEYKNVAYAFIPSNPGGLATTPGVAGPPTGVTGWKLRAEQIFVSDITEDMLAGSPATLVALLNQRAQAALDIATFVKIVDGEAVPLNNSEYPYNFYNGDIIEVEGFNGTISKARVTEFIWSQDSNGKKTFPTLEIIE